jgi:hypothetical protein
MTIVEVEGSIPGSFHDAMLEALHVDYIKREAALEMSVCVGDPDAHSEELREGARAFLL